MYKALKRDISQLDKESRSLQPDDAQHRILDFYTKVTPKLANAESCSIFIADQNNVGEWIRAGTGLAEEPVTGETVSSLCVGEAIMRGESVYKDKLDELEDYEQAIDAVPGFRARDVLCVPLHSSFDDTTAGAIQILNRQNGEPYGKDELNLLEELAHLLEVSLENIYLFDEARGVVSRTWQTLTRVTIVSTMVFVALLLAFTAYWFGFWFVGGL